MLIYTFVGKNVFGLLWASVQNWFELLQANGHKLINYKYWLDKQKIINIKNTSSELESEDELEELPDDDDDDDPDPLDEDDEPEDDDDELDELESESDEDVDDEDDDKPGDVVFFFVFFFVRDFVFSFCFPVSAFLALPSAFLLPERKAILSNLNGFRKKTFNHTEKFRETAIVYWNWLCIKKTFFS